MNSLVTSIIGLACLALLPAQANKENTTKYPTDRAVTVFEAGKNNPYASIRIPALIQVGKGHLIAFAEGRYQNTDQGKNDIIMSVSKNGGKTWGAVRTIAKANGATFNNPCPVFDAKTKTLSVFFQRYPAGVRERQPGIPTGWDDPKCIRNYVIHSKNMGSSWSKPVEVTQTTKRATGVDIMASGPNAGLQLKRGPHKGRLLIPMNEGPFGQWVLSCVYSDDGGKTWQISKPTTNLKGHVNETSIAETDDGGVVIIARHWTSGNCRRIVWSNDGGESWGQVQDCPELFCDSTQNSLVTYSYSDQAELGNKSRIIFSGPSKNRRLEGQLALSYDNGKTWPIKKLLGIGGFAYSSVAPVVPGVIGILYEENEEHIKKLKYVPVTLDWLTDGKDTGLAPGKKAPVIK